MDNNINFNTGVIDEHIVDSRLYNYETICASSQIAFPVVYELPKENCGKIKNQGSVGACAACAMTALGEVLYGILTGEKEEMSEGWAYGSYRNEDSIGEGLIVSQALDYWKTKGMLPKKYFDILYEMPDMKNMLKDYPELDEIAKRFKINGYVSINWADKERKDFEIKDAITKYGYGLIAVIPNFDRGQSHAVLITGWNDTNNTYIFQNSWGTNYGSRKDGFGAISKDRESYVYLVLLNGLELPFTDVNKNDWFYKNVKNNYFSGIMKGTSETTFEPDKNLTRAEAAALIDRIRKEYDERFAILNKVIEEKLSKVKMY